MHYDLVDIGILEYSLVGSGLGIGGAGFIAPELSVVVVGAGIDATEQSVWMGCRPSLPDSLPVIGYARRRPSILYAFGHQHLGMTLGPVTGFIIADLVAGRDPGIDLTPYRPERY